MFFIVPEFGPGRNCFKVSPKARFWLTPQHWSTTWTDTKSRITVQDGFSICYVFYNWSWMKSLSCPALHSESGRRMYHAKIRAFRPVAFKIHLRNPMMNIVCSLSDYRLQSILCTGIHIDTVYVCAHTPHTHTQTNADGHTSTNTHTPCSYDPQSCPVPHPQRQSAAISQVPI